MTKIKYRLADNEILIDENHEDFNSDLSKRYNLRFAVVTEKPTEVKSKTTKKTNKKNK